MSCQHKEFAANVTVARLEDSGKFIAEIKVSCAQCQTPFQFLGLQPGFDFNGATVSLDGLEANIAIAPQGIVPNPLQTMMNGRRFDA